jgi:hypothetical protein
MYIVCNERWTEYINSLHSATRVVKFLAAGRDLTIEKHALPTLRRAGHPNDYIS